MPPGGGGTEKGEGYLKDKDLREDLVKFFKLMEISRGVQEGNTE